MLIGYARVSKADGSQSLDLQRDALQAAGVEAVHVYHDFASGVRDDRPGLAVQDLSARSVGLRVLTGQGARIDTTTAAGRLVFGIFAALAEFERELDAANATGDAQRLTAALGASAATSAQDVRAVESPG